MGDYKPIKIKRKKRSDPRFLRAVLFRITPVALVVIITFCSFSIFNKRISEILANYKYSNLAERGEIDDPTLDTYETLNIDWLSAYDITDTNGLDPLLLSPLKETSGMRPSELLGSADFEKTLKYTNKQSIIWSLHDTVNPDISAWIYMYGMGINYPVARENGKKDYYLRRSYDGTQSNSGTIFMSDACKINPISRNLILHGHNMRDGTMFATLANYLKGTPEYYNAHKYIFLDTLYGTYRYEIYSVYMCDPQDIYLTVGFSSNAVFLNWCNATQERGIFEDYTTFTPEDRILTLSTCDSTNKKRIIVHAKMVYPQPEGDVESEIDFVTPTPDLENTPPDLGMVETPDISVSTPTPTPDESGSSTENIYTPGSKFRVNLSDPKSTLRLRSQPSTSSSILAALAHGTGITIDEEINEWVKITTEGGMTGYLQKKYLVKEEDFYYPIPSDTIGPPDTNLITPTPAPPTTEE